MIARKVTHNKNCQEKLNVSDGNKWKSNYYWLMIMNL